MSVEVKDLIEQFRPLLAEQKQQYESEVTALRKRFDETERTLKKRLDDAETAFTRAKQFGSGAAGTLADRLLNVNELLNRPADVPRAMSLSVPLRTKDVMGVSQQFPVPVPIVAELGKVPLGVRALIPTTEITGGSYQYIRETSFTNAAAPVAEGAAKQKSDKTFTPVTGLVETIAHWIRVSRQCYDDLPSLVTAIETNLIYGLNWKLEQQLLKGTGTTPQIQGIYPLAPAATAAPPANATFIDKLFVAAAEVQAKGYTPNGAVISSADNAAMQLLKDSTGRYILSDRVTLPTIVVSPHMATGEWLVGDFNQARIFMRQDANVVVGTADDDFVKNLVRLLGEMRLGLAVLQVNGFIKNPAA